jgi:hypothetical protein
MPYDRQNLEVEWVFVCRHLYQLRQLGPIRVLWWQNVARFLPWNVSNNYYASNLAVFLRQRLSELWTLNFDYCRICRGVSSNPCFDGGGKWVWTAHVLIWTRCWPYSVGRNGSIALQELQYSYWSLLWWKHPKSLTLAQQFLDGSVYHCVCKYGPANIRSGARESEFAW